jgi:hypothetical protein
MSTAMLVASGTASCNNSGRLGPTSPVKLAMPVHVHHGERATGINSDGVNNERIAFVMADGITVLGWCDVGRMLLVHSHLPVLLVGKNTEW